MEKVKPFGKRVLVKRFEAKSISSGGIHIPLDAKERPHYGEVRATGPEQTSLSEKDVVLFGKYSGVEIDVDGEILLILKEEELFGEVVDKELIEKFRTEGV